MRFLVSDDGTNTDAHNVAFYVADALLGFVSTFDPSGGSGACEHNLYYDAYQVSTDAAMTECVPFNTTAPLEIGASVAASFWDGSIYECSLWEKELTAIEANKFISPYFPGSDYNDGFYVDTCSQAASHATCSTQICRDGTPNACQAEGTGAMACFGQYTENIIDNSFETYAGDPSVANWTDWTEDEDPGAGGGIAEITAYLADTKHGDTSVRMVNINGTGASSTIMWGSCLVAGIGSDMQVEAAVKKLSGTANFRIAVSRYSDGACGAGIGVFTVRAYADIDDGYWQVIGGQIGAGDWGAAASYEIQLSQFNSDTDLLIDTVSMKVADYHTPWIENPSGGATTTANSRQYELHNPLSDYCESEDADCYLSGFCASAWVYTDWAGDDGVQHYIINVPTTGANANVLRLRKIAANSLYFDIWDGAGAQRVYSLVSNGTNWTAGGWKYIEACSNNSDNVLSAHHYNVSNSTWYDWSVAIGAGTGIQNGQSVDLHVGHAANANYCDCYQPEIHISPYNAIYPNIGFNNGDPPVNGAPY
jgi:hypothetical protein